MTTNILSNFGKNTLHMPGNFACFFFAVLGLFVFFHCLLFFFVLFSRLTVSNNLIRSSIRVSNSLDLDKA